MFKKFLATAALIGVVFSASAQADDYTEAKAKDIIKLMGITNALLAMEQIIGAYLKVQLPAVRRAIPKVTDDEMGSLRNSTISEFRKSTGEYLSAVVPIYAKHFTHDDVKEMIAFYETPLGKKFVKVMPALMGASMVAGQQWAQKVSNRMAPKLKADIQAIKDK